jgi:hypothetical protein
MSNPYQPSNSDEGDWFMTKFCKNCLHGKRERTTDESVDTCDILMRSLAFDIDTPGYPTEWIYDETDKPTCTAFKRVEIDLDGNEREVETYDNPNQLKLPL